MNALLSFIANNPMKVAAAATTITAGVFLTKDKLTGSKSNISLLLDEAKAVFSGVDFDKSTTKASKTTKPETKPTNETESTPAETASEGEDGSQKQQPSSSDGQDEGNGIDNRSDAAGSNGDVGGSERSEVESENSQEEETGTVPGDEAEPAKPSGSTEGEPVKFNPWTQGEVRKNVRSKRMENLMRMSKNKSLGKKPREVSVGDFLGDLMEAGNKKTNSRKEKVEIDEGLKEYVEDQTWKEPEHGFEFEN